MSDVLKMRYLIEIYEPLSNSEVLRNWETSAAPMAIAKGDLLTLLGVATGDTKDFYLIVTHVDHILYDVGSGVLTQKTMIFTRLATGSERRGGA